jgi:hypothetical protein
MILPMMASCSGTTTQLNNQTSNTFLELLKMQPDVPLANSLGSPGYILMHDYAKIRDVYGISLPSSSDEKEINKYLQAILNADVSLDTQSPGLFNFVWASGFFVQYLETSNIRSQNVGYGPNNIDASIDISSGLGLIGTFNPQATKNIFNKQDGWSNETKDNYTTENYQDITINSWGDRTNSGEIHLRDRLGLPAHDFLGRIYTLAVTQKNVFYSNSVANVKTMIDAKWGKSASLADVPKYATAARGLTELGAYSALISNDMKRDSFEFDSIKKSDTGLAPLLKPYQAFGSGEGKDDKGLYLAVVLVYNDQKSAADNAGILKARIDKGTYALGNTIIAWKQFFINSQINAEGNVVLAKLYFGAGPAVNRINTPFTTPLLLHE